MARTVTRFICGSALLAMVCASAMGGDAPAHESLPLGVPRQAAVDRGGASDGDWSSSSWARTGLALSGVVALALVGRLALRGSMRRFGGLAASLGAAGRAPSGVIEILGRYPVARGQTLVLLRLDRRVLLLSQTSAGFRTLSEVSDADDVASLVMKTRDEEGATAAARFNDLMQRMSAEPETIAAERGGEVSAGSGAPGGRLERLRGVRA